jgi:hypothetical protein
VEQVLHVKLFLGRFEFFLEEKFWGFLEGERVFVAGFGAEGFDLEILERGLGGGFLMGFTLSGSLVSRLVFWKTLFTLW